MYRKSERERRQSYGGKIMSVVATNVNRTLEWQHFQTASTWSEKAKRQYWCPHTHALTHSHTDRGTLKVWKSWTTLSRVGPVGGDEGTHKRLPGGLAARVWRQGTGRWP